MRPDITSKPATPNEPATCSSRPSTGCPRGHCGRAALNLMAGVQLYDDNWTDAVAFLERALDDAEEQPGPAGADPERAAHSRNEWSRSSTESLDSARKAVVYAEVLGDPVLISRALAMSVQLNLHVRIRGRRAGAATRARAGGSRRRSAHPVPRQHGRGSGAGVDGAVGRGPHSNGVHAAGMHRTRRRKRSDGRCQLHHLDRDLAGQLRRRPRSSPKTPWSAPSWAAVRWPLPCRCGRWWPLTLGENTMRASTRSPPLTSPTEPGRRVWPSGR